MHIVSARLVFPESQSPPLSPFWLVFFVFGPLVDWPGTKDEYWDL